MKVFLSWSGPTSKQIAVALRDWLPNVIQAIEPWMSSEDIRKGARWSSSVANELEATKAGIVCVTPENQNAPWLNFEAGALSKTVQRQEMVCTYLFRLKPSDVTGPLKDFQATEATKEDTQKLIFTLNKATEKSIDDGKLKEAFEVWWSKLESQLAQISTATHSVQKVSRPPEDLLAEILGIVRDQGRMTDSILGMVNATYNHVTLASQPVRQGNLTNLYHLMTLSTPPGNVADSGASSKTLLNEGFDFGRLSEPLTAEDFNPPGAYEGGDHEVVLNFLPPEEEK